MSTEIESRDQLSVDDPRRWLRWALPLLILLLGIGLTYLLIRSRKPPTKKARVDKAQLVETIAAHWQKRNLRVASNGVIRPQREVTIAPQVNGTVTWVNSALVVGGLLSKGAPLLKIERQDYELALQQARAQIATAERQLAETRSNAEVARKEWSVLGAKAGKKASPLTLYIPQLRAAEANLKSSKAQLAQAEVNLRRTTIRAPFNLRVRHKSVDLGQYVRVGQTLATIYGTDVAEVIVSLPATELRWLEVPKLRSGARRDLSGPAVKVLRPSGDGQDSEHEGRLVRSVGEVDPTGRMSQVVVAVEDPFNLKRAASAPPRPDLEIGAFVRVVLPGKSLNRVIVLPSAAIRIGSTVWTVDDEMRLQVKKVSIARRDNDETLIAAGLKEGERVVLTALSGAVSGMKVRVSPRHAKGTDQRHGADS